jgi:hypothetical protein
MDDHAPLMKKKLRKCQVPFMSSTYRRAIYKKSQLKNRYHRFPTATNWELFRQQRNLCTDIRHYFKERCGGGDKNKDFYGTMKPFLSRKSMARKLMVLF